MRPRQSLRACRGVSLERVTLSDEALLAGLAEGDHSSAAAFVRRFQARVFGVALAIVGDPDSAEEVAQETFVRAWRHAASYNPHRGCVAAWLLTIARNQAIDARRHRRFVPVDPEELVAMPLEAEEMGPEEHAVAGWEAGRLRSALADLPAEQRRALVLAAFGGLTAREIGEVEGIPVGTAKTRIRGAMLKLRLLLGVRDG
jgi:RNA polymerase sigma factor (sigma-70 family)